MQVAEQAHPKGNIQLLPELKYLALCSAYSCLCQQMKVMLLPPIWINRNVSTASNLKSERWIWVERKYFRWAIIGLSLILPLFIQVHLWKREWRERMWVDTNPLLNTYSGPDFMFNNFTYISLLIYHNIPWRRHYCFLYYIIRSDYVTISKTEQSFLPLSAHFLIC